MRRTVLVASCLTWLAMVLACTGAAATVFAMPGGFSLFQTDHHDYWLWRNSSSEIPGHVTHIGYDDRHIVLRRDVAEYPSHTQYRLTGRIEFWVVEVGTAARHGPYTEEELGAARERLGVRPGLRLEPSDSRAARRQQ